jgi:hypothetical protein
MLSNSLKEVVCVDVGSRLECRTEAVSVTRSYALLINVSGAIMWLISYGLTFS